MGVEPKIESPLAHRLFREYGAVVGGQDLTKLLGFRTYSTFRMALTQGRIGVRVFSIMGRKGKFALTDEIAEWLLKQAHSGAASNQRDERSTNQDWEFPQP